MTKEKRKVKINIGNGSPITTQKFDRNSKCRCGSGKKTKHCCGEQTKFFYTKKNEPIKNESNNQLS